MGILDMARADMLAITTDSDGFGVSLAFEDPEGEEATVVGLATRHHLSTDNEGRVVNGTNAHCSFSEAAFADIEYPLRNETGEVKLKDHKVSWADSAGVTRTYVINETYPDETLGLIVCILGDYE